ncbi:MAG: ATPase [Bacteroidetes bacterium GWA2_32_17]|nr:MAG: ATPase [Bacteroidetes bacterium GWA2_32_17]
MKRDILKKLVTWKSSPNRKPLILQGARQVGKTWLLKNFGLNSFKSVAYFNFDEQTDLKQFFTNTKDVKRIIQNLSLIHGKAIKPHETLIIFDEIQECNEALNTLKYFHENASEYLLVCAGSLLGVALSRGKSFPVGKVEFMTLYPLTFSEFLLVAEPNLYKYVKNIKVIEPIPDIFFNRLIELFKMYFITGGMPEAVVSLLEKQDVELTQKVLKDIIIAYNLDFSKHVENKDIPKISFIWSSIPSQLARENKKFLYQSVKHGARAREYEDSLLWLVNAGLIYKIFRCTKPSLPISAYDDVTSFKVYLLDVGLLRRHSLIDPIAVKEGNRLFVEFKGALSENYILQSIVTQFETLPRYWTSDSKAEIDFIIQYKNDIIPIEVKSDNNVQGKSLTFYNKQFKPSLRIRYSLKNLKHEEGLVNIPLFMADFTKKLIDITKNKI